MYYLENVDHRVINSISNDLPSDYVRVRWTYTQLKILFLQHFLQDESVNKITNVVVNLRGLDVPLPSQLSR